MTPWPDKVKPLQSDVAFSYIQLFGNKYNFSNLYCQYYSLPLHQPRKLGRYLNLEQYFPVQNQKRSCYEAYLQVVKALSNNLG